MKRTVTDESDALRKLQESFLTALRAAEDGRDDALAAFAAFATPPVSTAAARWNVYRDGYFSRLQDAIANDFPALARIVGPGPFRSLIRRYLTARPPISHDLGQAGAHLADDLVADPLTVELPFLPDLARFEWALAASVVAADSEPLGRDDLAVLGDALFDLPLALAPGAAVLISPWPLPDLWACRDQPDDAIHVEVVGRSSRLVVFRQGPVVRWREIADDEATFLGAVAAGQATLAALCDGGLFGAPEEAAPRLVALSIRCLESSILRFDSPRTPDGVLTSEKEIDP